MGCLLLHYQWGLDRSPGSPMLLIWLGPLSFHCHIIVFEPKKKHDTLHKLMGTNVPASSLYIFHPESMNVSHKSAGL